VKSAPVHPGISPARRHRGRCPGVDIDRETLEWAAARNGEMLCGGAARRLCLVHANVLDDVAAAPVVCPSAAQLRPCAADAGRSEAAGPAGEVGCAQDMEFCQIWQNSKLLCECWDTTLWTHGHCRLRCPPLRGHDQCGYGLPHPLESWVTRKRAWLPLNG
jgi:hypothetical protein